MSLRQVFWTVLPYLFVFVAEASEPFSPVAVVYPQTTKPYSRVFQTILEGIESRLGATRVRRYAATEGDKPEALKHWIEQQRPAAVITLGRLAFNAYEKAALKLPRVIGALDASPQLHSGPGVSLQVDPELLFKTLRRLAPKVKRVWVVYNPERDRWLYDLATHTSTRHGIELYAHEATALKAAAKAYWQFLKEANPETDALWLPIDNTIIDDSLLPVIIEQSWYRRLIVFSNNLMHANMGVLFALFPDNHELGATLAEKAIRLIEPGAERCDDQCIEPLRAIKTAVNLRVSNHLGLSIDPSLRRQLDIIFRPQ